MAERAPGERHIIEPPDRMLQAGLIGLWVLLPLYAVSLWACNYGATFGERDSYRVFVGIVDAMTHGADFRGPLMYGEDASPGYYLFLKFFISAFRIDIHQLIAALNAIGFACSLLCLIPLYVVGAAVGGERQAWPQLR